MGFMVSKFRKVPDSPGTQLELLNKDIAEIESYRQHDLDLQKKIVGSLLIYSILIYLVSAILFFVYYFPILSARDKALYCMPLILFPALVYGIKKSLHWYFVKRITQNDLKLAKLKEKKNKVIDDIMEKETYKKATELLQKYAPGRLRKLSESRDGSEAASPNQTQRSMARSPSVELRQRKAPGSPQPPPGSVPPTPAGATFNRTLGAAATSTPSTLNKITMQQRTMYGGPPGPPLPRQVIPRDRSYVDKMVEYLVGDGPQNRYALICRYCKSHNGMALPEEFEYLSFRCCYCFNMNESRKNRPNAPRLNLDTTVASTDDEEADEDTESSDADGEELMEDEEVQSGNQYNQAAMIPNNQANRASTVEPVIDNLEQQGAASGDKKTN